MEPALATAVRTASLLLDGEGRLPRGALFDCTIRAALMIDLALAGRVVQLEDCVEVDASPSGVRVLDKVLGELTTGQQTIDQQISGGSVSLTDVSRHLVDSGCWARRGALRRRRFDVLHPASVHLRGLSARALQRAEPAVARLLEASGIALRPPKPSWRAPSGAGEVEWLVATAVAVLRDVRQLEDDRGQLLRLADAGPPRPSPFA